MQTQESSTMLELTFPASSLFIGPIQQFISIEGTASLEDNRLKTLKHAQILFLGFQRHGST